MGCDIHTVLQAFDDKDGKWKDVHTDAFDGRCYELFGILAGVRDCSVEPIQVCRGLPKGFKMERCQDNELLDEFDVDHVFDPFNDHVAGTSHGRFWMGEHSFGWVTLQELMNYPWETTSWEDIPDFVMDWSAAVQVNTEVRDFNKMRLVFGFDS